MDDPRYLHINTVKVRYFDAGSDDMTIVLLHGFCCSSEYYELVFPHLAQHYRVVAIDLPGHGGSGVIPGMHRLEDTACFLNKVLQRLGIEKHVLVGHSLGGYIALAYAERYLQRLQGLVLFHSIAAADSPERRQERENTLKFVEYRGQEVFINNFIPKIFYQNHARIIQTALEIGKKTDFLAVTGFIDAMRNRYDRTNLLKSLEIPILYLIGGHDEIINRMHILQEVALTQNGSRIYLEDSGHAGMYEEPERTADALRSFMEEVRGGVRLF